jgi:lipopolysaccharide/colanic/teichoic acid biosynthesis glycosyltransferase
LWVRAPSSSISSSGARRSTQCVLRATSGITSPWQVYGRGDLTLDEVRAVKREHVDNLSLGRGVRIILMTLPAVFGRREA